MFAVCRVSVGAGAVLGGRGAQTIAVVISVAGATTDRGNLGAVTVVVVLVADDVPAFASLTQSNSNSLRG